MTNVSEVRYTLNVIFVYLNNIGDFMWALLYRQVALFACHDEVSFIVQ